LKIPHSYIDTVIVNGLTSLWDGLYCGQHIDISAVVPVSKHHIIKIKGSMEVIFCALLTWY